MRFLLFLPIFILMTQFSLQAAVLDDRLETFRSTFAPRYSPRHRGSDDPRLHLMCSNIPQLFHETDRSVNELIDVYAKLSFSQLKAVKDNAQTLFLPGYRNDVRVKIVEAASVLLPHEIRARAQAFALHHSFLRATGLDQDSQAYLTSLALTLMPQELDERARLMRLYLNWLYPDEIYHDISFLVTIVALNTPAKRLRENFGQIIRHSNRLFPNNLTASSRAIAVLNLLQISSDSIPVIASVIERYEGIVSGHDAYRFLCELTGVSLRSPWPGTELR